MPQRTISGTLFRTNPNVVRVNYIEKQSNKRMKSAIGAQAG